MKNVLNTKLKENKAITLVALVVTLIILLILATVSLAQINKKNGLFIKTSDAKEEYENSEKIQEKQIADYEDQIELTTSRTLSDDIKTLNDEIVSLKEQLSDLQAKTNYRAGSARMPQCGSGGQVTVAVSFSQPYDDDNYSVSVQSSYTGANWAQATYTIQNKTANGFTIRMFEWSGTKAAHTVYWTAIPYRT